MISDEVNYSKDKLDHEVDVLGEKRCWLNSPSISSIG